MRENFKSKLQNGELMVGTVITLAAPEVAEIISLAGYDFLWLDTEHTPNNLAQAQTMIQAAGDRCYSVIRIPENLDGWIKKALDIGPDGIMIPQIRTAAEAQVAVKRCLYPPAGTRGVGLARAHQYGLNFQNYVDSANDELTIILQIEHIQAVENIDSIVQVPGIGALLVGPFDLSGTMDLLGQVNHPEVKAAITKVVEACKTAGLPVGIFASDPETAAHWVAAGVNLIGLGIDVAYLLNGAQEALDRLRG